MATVTVRSAVIGAISGSLLVLTFEAAAAAVLSDRKYFHSNGVSYDNGSHIEQSSVSGTNLFRNSHGSAGVGKMGAKPRVYWSNGVLCSAGVMHYNLQSTVYFDVRFDSNCGGYIYGRGRTETWNGNGFDNHSTFRTPNVAG